MKVKGSIIYKIYYLELSENDSFITFEEILEIGKAENVDFVLLGGDLFHENKPKPATLHRAMEILRKHCLGSKYFIFKVTDICT